AGRSISCRYQQALMARRMRRSKRYRNVKQEWVLAHLGGQSSWCLLSIQRCEHLIHQSVIARVKEATALALPVRLIHDRNRRTDPEHGFQFSCLPRGWFGSLISS